MIPGRGGVCGRARCPGIRPPENAVSLQKAVTKLSSYKNVFVKERFATKHIFIARKSFPANILTNDLKSLGYNKFIFLLNYPFQNGLSNSD